jgi:hypothetical protein
VGGFNATATACSSWGGGSGVGEGLEPGRAESATGYRAVTATRAFILMGAF